MTEETEGFGGRLLAELDTERDALLAFLEADVEMTPEQEASVEAACRRALGVTVDARQLGPFARNSETSRRAAIASYGRQGSHRWKIMRCLVRQPAGEGWTRQELARLLSMSENTVRPRVKELIDGGWICEHETATRPTSTGNDAAVLVVTAVGRADWQNRERGEGS